MKIRLYILSIFFMILKTSSYPQDVNFNQFINNYSSVKSLSGTIVQHVYDGASSEKISGDYFAVREGWFRIDYNEPEKQIVICNNKGLYWYYPDRNLVFVAKKVTGNSSSSVWLPGNPISEKFNDVNICYRGIRFYGLLKYAHVYTFKNAAGNNSVIIWFEPGRRYVVRKYIIDNSGHEIMKEIYHQYFTNGTAYIPSKIELFVCSQNGIIHTLTEYSNISVNYQTDMRIFEFIIKNNMTLREFNEYK